MKFDGSTNISILFFINKSIILNVQFKIGDHHQKKFEVRVFRESGNDNLIHYRDGFNFYLIAPFKMMALYVRTMNGSVQNFKFMVMRQL